jgi:hypothetical protein
MITIDELKTFGHDNIENYFDAILEAYAEGYTNQCRMMASVLDRDQRYQFQDHIEATYHYDVADCEWADSDQRKVLSFFHL